MHSHQLQGYDTINSFVLAGNCTFTLKSKRTGKRYTYKITKTKNDKQYEHVKYWVKVLVGPDNKMDYEYVGYLVGDHDNGYKFVHGKKKSKFTDRSNMYNQVIDWFFFMLTQKKVSDKIEVWHEGRCGRCGRKLTVPESIETGLGPVCAGL